MRKLALLVTLPAALFAAGVAQAATVDFEDLGVAPGTQLNPASGVSQDSRGYTFTPGPNDTSGLNDLHFHNQDGIGDNGTTNLGTHDDVVMTKVGGGTFSLSAFDFAGFISETSVDLVGILSGGGSLNVSFVADGVPSTYQTFNLVGWNNLLSVTWTKPTDGANGFFLDNIVTTSRGGVPEPGSWIMMLAGFFIVGSALHARRNQMTRHIA